MTSLTIARAQGSDNDLARLADMAVLSLASPASRRNYSRELRRYLATGRPLDRENVQAYVAELRDSGVGAATQNVSLAAVRLLAKEAWQRGLVDDQTIAGIERIKGASIRGGTCGNWLNLAGVKLMLEHAGHMNNPTRNKALIACMVGCGLRRAEVCGLEWRQWQQREERWVWIDVKGKGGRVRTVPCPGWAAEFVEAWRVETCGQPVNTVE